MRPAHVLLALASLCLGASCTRRSSSEAPRVSLAGSTAAQKELRDLEERWEIAGEVGRKELRVPLEEFLERYPTDPSVARARLLLGRIAIAERRFGAAEELLEPLISGKPGATRDEAFVVLSSLDNRMGNHAMALARLEPLEGKLLTQDARDQYARERISAALALRRWRLVIDSMVDWLSESEGSSQENQRWIRDAVVKVPAGALSRLLTDWPQTEEDGPEHDARKWIQRVVVEHLTRVALSTQDRALSRELLENSPPWLRASKSGEQLSFLAAMAQREARVSGRAVGVVLGGTTDERRRRAVRVAAGLIHGLGESAQPSAPNGERAVRFVAAEDRGSLAAALSALSGMGASVLVAGVDPQGAEQALAFAESKGVPVVTMSEPRARPRILNYGFVAGVSETTQLVAMESGTRDVRSWRFVGTLERPCSTQPGELEALPLWEWKEQGVEGLGVLGDERCLNRVLRQLGQTRWEPFVAVGLEAARGPFPLNRAVSYLSSGDYPGHVDFVRDGVSSLERRLADGELPSSEKNHDWYFTLGRDVALLIETAIKNLPETQVTEKDAVEARHKQALRELERARASLLSTQARGFSDDHRIERSFLLQQAEPQDDEEKKP